MTLTRRQLLAGGAALGIAAGVGVPLALGASSTASPGGVLRSTAPLPTPFRRRLHLPRVLEPVSTDDGVDRYVIRQRLASASILPGLATTLWTYAGEFPGPTIVTRRGRSASIRQINELPVSTVTHLHGGRTPPESDGYPTAVVEPGEERVYDYPLDQRAATLWYHDHRMDFTGPSVWRGLAGFHLVRDEEEEALGLPSGARELPLLIADRSFAADGSLLYPSLDPLLGVPGVLPDFVAGVLGDVMLVNGVPWPVAQVEPATYRIRLLNACNARRLDLRLSASGGDVPFVQIGSDGGLLAEPVEHMHVTLAPAQRLDALVDFSALAPGTEVTLRNDLDGGAMGAVVRFVVGRGERSRFRVPDRLAELPLLRRSDAITTRTFGFQAGDVHHSAGWLIDGRPFDPDRIDAAVKLGSVEVWRLRADFHHPVHLHLAPFQVLSRGIGGPGPFDAGWKDTIDLRPSEEAEIIVRFDGYRGRYVFHCHVLEHEDMAMMANLQVE